MNVFSRERLNFESDLRRALPQKQFELHYQPKMDVATDRVNSAEALLRWRHPSRGLIGLWISFQSRRKLGSCLPSANGC